MQVLTTVATEGKGVAELWEGLERFRQEQPAEARRAKRRVLSIVEQLWDEALKEAQGGEVAVRLEAESGESPYALALSPPGSLERTEFKARRIVDKRGLYAELTS